MGHFRQTQTGPASATRRHFLGVASAAATRIAGAGALVGTLVASSSAHAERGENGKDDRGGVRCFARGTHIQTPDGEVRIEELRIGDLVTTVRGELLPIKWIARNVFRRTGPRWPQSALPVRVSAFALDANTPHRDLYLSPGHCLFLEGHLMAVQDLVNATSITVAESPGTEIEYFHLILARHEVVLAEGAPTETLLMWSGTEYESFSNFVEYERLYSNQPAAKMVPFAPLVGSCQGGGRSHLKALLRLAVAPDPLRLAYDKLAQRASAAV